MDPRRFHQTLILRCSNQLKFVIENIGRKDPRPDPFPPAAFLVRALSALRRWLLFGRWDGPLVVVIIELAYPCA
jgi:hypothetical protein